MCWPLGTFPFITFLPTHGWVTDGKPKVNTSPTQLQAKWAASPSWTSFRTPEPASRSIQGTGDHFKLSTNSTHNLFPPNNTYSPLTSPSHCCETNPQESHLFGDFPVCMPAYPFSSYTLCLHISFHFSLYFHVFTLMKDSPFPWEWARHMVLSHFITESAAPG